jgi:6,7-dimethyl-8-ribityllumazine synthase
VSTGKRSYAADSEGRASGRGRRFALLVARFNSHVTGPLLESAHETLVAHGASEDDVDVFHVPGAFELPLAALRAAGSERFHAVVALGCVIRGETPHFDFISAETARGLGDVALRSGVPVIFGVLTTDSEAQALARSSREGGDKGREAALAALEMADLMERII